MRLQERSLAFASVDKKEGPEVAFLGAFVKSRQAGLFLQLSCLPPCPLSVVRATQEYHASQSRMTRTCSCFPSD